MFTLSIKHIAVPSSFNETLMETSNVNTHDIEYQVIYTHIYIYIYIIMNLYLNVILHLLIIL